MASSKKDKSMAILFNSVKGGAGKTSLAISTVMTAGMFAAPTEPQFKVVYYFDLDLDGTGTEYLLDLDFAGRAEDKKRYLNHYETKKDEIKCKHPFPWFEDGALRNTHVFLLDPSSRVAGRFHDDFLEDRIETACLDSILMRKIIDLVTSYTREPRRSLFVFDCAPGHTGFAKEFASRLRDVENLDVTEAFVTTLDASHVEKTIGTVRDLITKDNRKTKRKIILHDIHNAKDPGSGKRGGGYLSDVAEKVAELSKLALEHILIKAYNPAIANHSAYMIRGKLTDLSVADAYLDPGFYYKLLH